MPKSTTILRFLTVLLLIHGEEKFLAEKKLRAIVQRYSSLRQKSFNLFKFDVLAAPHEGIFQLLFGQQSLFGEGHGNGVNVFAVIEHACTDVELSKKLTEAIAFGKEKFAGKNAQTILLFFENITVAETNPLFLFLRKHGKVDYFPSLSVLGKQRAMRKILAENALALSPVALEYLKFVCGDDLFKFEQEAKKVAAFEAASNTQKAVSLEDVQAIVPVRAAVRTLAILDAMSQKQKTQSVKLWYLLQRQGEDRGQILALVIWHLRNLISARAMIDRRFSFAEMRMALKLHPFVVKKIYEQAKYFTLDALKRCLDEAVNLDTNFKTGRAELDPGFEKIVAGL